MEKRRLGSEGLTSSIMGLGCMGMSEFYGEGDKKESVKVIHEALERGINMLDTADMYGLGENEELIGKAVADRRDKALIATKFGVVRNREPEQEGYIRMLNASPEYIKSACEASLKRLGIETIDLYYMHRKDPNVEIEETVSAMAELVREGKVRYLGLSEVSADTLKRADSVHPISALQTEYSLWTRHIEGKILDTCRELGVGLVPYSPLGRGFLTGAVTKIDSLHENDFRRVSPRFAQENFDTNMKMVEELRIYAAEIGYKPSQLALAWVLSKGDDIFPIPGTKRLKYLLDNISAIEIKLTETESSRLEKIIDINRIKGLRYPEAGMQTIDK